MSKNTALSSSSAGGKANPFGVALKPVGKNLTLDRGANSVITTSKENRQSEKSASLVERLKPAFRLDAGKDKKLGVTKPLSSVTSTTKSTSTTTTKVSPRSVNAQATNRPKSTCSAIKIGGFTLSKESTQKERPKSEFKSGSISPETTTDFSHSPFHKSLNSRNPGGSSYDPLTGEIKLKPAQVEKFSKVQGTKKTVDPPWKVQLKTVDKSKSEDKEVKTVSKSGTPEFSVREKDNSRRSIVNNRTESLPVKTESKVTTNLTKVKQENKNVLSAKLSGNKTSESSKTKVKEVSSVTKDRQKSISNKKVVQEDSSPKTSPRGAFVSKLIAKCETRDEYKDSNVDGKELSNGSLQFPDTLLEKLAVLEGLVDGCSSDESGDSDDDDEGYNDVAAVIECLAEEGIIDITKEMGTLKRRQHARAGDYENNYLELSDKSAKGRDYINIEPDNSRKAANGKILHGSKLKNYENITDLPKNVVQAYDWVDPVELSSTEKDAKVTCNYELAEPVDWSMHVSNPGGEKKKRRFAFRDVKLKKVDKSEKDKKKRQSSPALLSHKLKPVQQAEPEDDNIYNIPDETGFHIPDWDTGSSRVSVAESESTSSDSVTNSVNVRPHTVIELSDKQAKKLKKRQADNTESSAKWKKKWKQFYRRSQDLLDIPGLQTKLENLSLAQLPANVKQKLREKIKKKKTKKTGHLEINPVDEDDEFTASSSEDVRSDPGECIYQTITETGPIVNLNIRVSTSPEKIPISPPTGQDSLDSAPNLPPRTNTGSVYEKYSELGPRVNHNSPPSLPSTLPPSLPPKQSELTPPTKPKLNYDKRTSLPSSKLIHGDLEEAPPLPPRNGRMSLGNLETRVPLQSSAGSLSESYLKQPKLADKFPSESPSRESVKRDSLLLGRVPPPLHKPADTSSLATGGPLGQGYLDMDQDEGKGSKESSPSRSTASKGVPAPFENVMDFKKRSIDRKPDMTQVDFDLELDVSVSRSRYKSRFEREPLYQYYNKDYIKRQSWQRALSEEPSSPSSDSDKPGHEYINPEVTITISVDEHKSDLHSVPEGEAQNLPSANRPSTLNQSGTVQRSLWSELPEVISSGVVDSLTQEQRKEQEGMFEIITSEASYFKSLNVLINVFVMSPELCGEISDKAVITKQDKHLLFSNIGAVRDASEKFLCDLEARWNENVLIEDISDIIIKHASENFDCYVKYCSNKTYQDRIYTNILKSSPSFKEALIRLQGQPDVQGLPMASFFLLPMQRITRLPLLMDGVCRHRDNAHKNYKLALQAQDTLNKLVKKCNDGAKRMEQTEQLCMIEKQLDFKIKKVPIVSSSRHLVKEGELTRIITESNSKLPFGKNKPGKQSVYFFLLNDLLLVTKKKGESLFSVIDCTQRNSVHCELVENPDKFPLLPNGAPSGCKNVFLLAMLENHEGKQVELILSCNSPSDRARWMEAFTPTTQVSDNEKVYEEWDCPQVQAIHRYNATQPDELDMEEADVVNVFRKMADGWYEGERIRDGARGWFPQSYVEEILSSHVRARNLRLRYRLLVASKEFAAVKKN